MITIYNVLLVSANLLLRIFPLSFIRKTSKLALFVKGQRNILARIRDEYRPSTDDICWVHVASLGEYGVVRSLLRQMREHHPHRVIVLTFFSSTGYEALKNNRTDVDYVFYLPLDTRAQACEFLEIIHPRKAVFAVSEYWCNYLLELKRRCIPVYLVSALVGRKFPLNRWYAPLYREAFTAYTRILVLNDKSSLRLNGWGVSKVTVTGDPLFDNSMSVARRPYTNDVVERFSLHGPVFIAGSISDRKDLELVCALANHHPDLHCIFVPHEISAEGLDEIKYRLRGKALCYSECVDTEDLLDTQVLIIDFVGALASLYRYATWAYVGGGFTPYLHNILEAVAYGLPVAFGPNIHRKSTALDLIEEGVGCVVNAPCDLERWFVGLENNTDELERIRLSALAYMQSGCGATSSVYDIIEGNEA